MCRGLDCMIRYCMWLNTIGFFRDLMSMQAWGFISWSGEGLCIAWLYLIVFFPWCGFVLISGCQEAAVWLYLEFYEVTNTRHELRLKVRILPLVAGAWPKHFPLEITSCKESISVEQYANGKMPPRALEAPSQFVWDVWERHTVPRARRVFCSLNNWQLWHFPACQQPLPKKAWNGRLPYIAAFWKNFIPSTCPNVWVDSTIKKMHFNSYSDVTWSDNGTFIVPGESNIFIFYYLKYVNLSFLLKRKKKDLKF